MKFLQEVTEWSASNIPNHIYYLNDSKTRMVGYIKSGTDILVKLKSPVNIDIRGRKFVELKNLKAERDEVYFGVKQVEAKPVDSIEVKGSKGQTYTMTKNLSGRYTCSCPGYMFRRTCKHIQTVS